MMHQTLKFAIAAILVLVVLIMAWNVFRGVREGFDGGSVPDRLREVSSGSYDADAAEALRISELNDTPEDHTRAASIITRNVLAQGRTRGRARRNLRDRARRHYEEALRETPLTTNNPVVDLALDFVFNPLYGLVGENDDFIIGGGAFGMFGGQIVELEEIPGRPTFGGGTVDFEFPRALATLASHKKEEEVAVRQHVAKETAKDVKGLASEVYLDLSTTHTNDSENTHDTSVNACLKAIADRLRDDQKGNYPSIEAVVGELRSGAPRFTADPKTKQPRPQLLADALQVVERMKLGERAVAVGLTDEEALRRVWARTYDERNRANRDKMQQAVFDALVDAWKGSGENRRIVCVNGRVSRLLGSLTLLDFDRANWEVKTLEQYKNDIFDLSGKILKKRALKWSKSENPKHKAVGLGYLAKTPAEAAAAGDADEESEEAFAKETRQAISDMVDKYTKDNPAIPAYMIESVRKEAMAAVV